MNFSVQYNKYVVCLTRIMYRYMIMLYVEFTYKQILWKCCISMEDVMTMRSIELKTYIYAFNAIENCMCD